MDQDQLDIALAVIGMDCEIVGCLRNENGKFCAVGSLFAVLDPDWAVTGKTDDDPYEAVGEAFDLDFNGVFQANDKNELLSRPSSTAATTARRARVTAELHRQAGL